MSPGGHAGPPLRMHVGWKMQRGPFKPANARGLEDGARACQARECTWAVGMPRRLIVSPSKSNSISTTGSLPTTQPS